MDNNLIKWKTDAWKNPDMVAWYHQRMIENRGTSRLKNQVETRLCARFALAPKLLDVGIGTGRGSLPLARAGFEVTGIDSSQAMLDQTRRLAGDTPIRLMHGDVLNPRFEDAEFDTVVSLNVLVHFPNWREILAGWKRVVRPGGRIIFDIHSLDHEDAACAAKSLPRRPEVAGSGYGDYTCRVRVSEIAETADKLGLCVHEVVPYAGIFSGGNINLWLNGSLADGTRYDRMLSWLTSDSRFMEFALFLEQEVFARLTSRVTGRIMVVLENIADQPANRAWLERDSSLNAALAGADVFQLLHLVPAFDDEWRRRFNELLDWPRNRVFLFFLLTAWRDFPGHLDLAPMLADRHAATLAEWLRQDAFDRETTAVLHEMAGLSSVRAALNYRGVPLAHSLEYELTRAIMRGALLGAEARS